MNSDCLQVPDVLKKDYIYLRLLGEGSCGRTWLAKDLRSGEEVAVKELKFYDNYKQVDLFLRESETLKTIDVRGVPKYYKNVNAAVTNATSYLIQEYIPYPSLQSLLEQGRKFSDREVLDILCGIGKILYELQNRYTPPILHRDIKPSNILYNDMHGRVEVYLIDFGSVANPQKQSESSTVAGTFGYMAPEQLMGESRIQSDFYALGATAVHLLCGVPPYEISHDVFSMEFETVFAEKNIRISPQFIALLRSLLAPEISKRPADAAVLLTAIRNVMEERSPFETAVPVKAPGLLRRLFRANMDNSLTPQATAKGHIQAVCRHYNKYVFEYTFEEPTNTWIGFADICSEKYTILPEKELRFSNRNVSALEIPDQCEVTYAKNNPGYFNFLKPQTIYLSDRIYTQYVQSLNSSKNS